MRNLSLDSLDHQAILKKKLFGFFSCAIYTARKDELLTAYAMTVIYVTGVRGALTYEMLLLKQATACNNKTNKRYKYKQTNAPFSPKLYYCSLIVNFNQSL